MIGIRLRAALRTAAILVTVVGLLPTMGSHAQAQAQVDTRYFPETGQTVQGRFLEYWEQNGGLMQQGYPISGDAQERSEIDGKVYTMQYFERAVFELHPEYAAPNDVLLSLLGVLKYNEKYPGGAPDQRENHDAGGAQFAETGKWVGGSFLVYFSAHGGVRQQGLPISNEFQERSELDGNIRTVQYFERAVFEWNPSNQPPYNVLLAQLGTFALRAKQGGTGQPPLLEPAIPAPLDPGKNQYYPHASGRYLVWNEGQISGPVDRQQPSEFDIRALDMATNRSISVTTAPGNQVDPRVDGQVVAWRSENYGCADCPPNGAYARDLVTGNEYTVALDDISNNSQTARSPVAAGRYVAWVQIGNSYHQHLLAKNLDNGTVIEARTLITGTPDVTTTIQGLQGGGNFLVWNELSSVTTRVPGAGQVFPFNIYSYNLQTGQLTNIFSNIVNGNYVGFMPVYSLSEGRVILADKAGGLTLLDLANNTRTEFVYRGDVQDIELHGDRALVTAEYDSAQIDGFGLASDEQQVVHLLQADPGTLPQDLPWFNATIAGDWLVWSDSYASSPRLAVKKIDLKTGTQSPPAGAPAVPPPARHVGQFGPVASGAYLYWQECEIGDGAQKNCAIRGLNTETAEITNVVSGLESIVALAASGSTVVWNIPPMNCASPCANAGIFTAEFGAGVSVVVTGTTYRTSPAIAGKTIAWSETSEGTVRVMIKDGDTGVIKPVAELPTDDAFIHRVQISDDYIAWDEVNSSVRSGHKSSIRVYDRKSGDVGTVFAFDYDLSQIRSLQFSLDEHAIAIKYEDSFFVRNLVTNQQTSVQGSGFISAMQLRGNALVYANSPVMPSPYGGPQGMGVYGVDLRQPGTVQTLVAPQVFGTQSYEFATLGDWLVYSDRQAQQPMLRVLRLPESLKQ